MRLTFCKSLKTHVEKMSVFSLSIILMKTRELNRSLHYVDENKGARSFRESALRRTRLTPGLVNHLFPRPSLLLSGLVRGRARLAFGRRRRPRSGWIVRWCSRQSLIDVLDQAFLEILNGCR